MPKTTDEPSEDWGPSPRCTQPQCLLQQPGVDSERLAQLVVQALAEGETPEVVPEELRIVPREVCLDCVERVMEGRAPYWTDEQWAEEKKKLVESGKRSYRRHRRRS